MKNLKVHSKRTGQLSHYLTYWMLSWKIAKKQETTSPHEALQNIDQPFSENMRPSFLIYVCWKKWKRHRFLMLHCCDSVKATNISDFKHGATMYPCIWCSPLKDSIRELRVRSTWITHEMNDVYQLYRHQCIVNGKLLKKWKQWEARA